MPRAELLFRTPMFDIGLFQCFFVREHGRRSMVAPMLIRPPRRRRRHDDGNAYWTRLSYDPCVNSMQRTKEKHMSAIDNLQHMRDIFSAMSEGSLGPLFDAMAEDMQWRWMGTDQWSRTFVGKEAVVNELFGAVKETLTPSFQVVVHRFISDGEYVVVEHSGRNTTPDGRRYDNNYCRSEEHTS